MLEIKVCESLGNIINAKISDDFKKAALYYEGEKLADAHISYANMKPPSPIINDIVVYKGTKNYKRVIELVEAKTKQKITEDRDIHITISDSYRKLVSDEIVSIYNRFFEDLVGGKIQITANTIGNYPSETVLSIDNKYNVYGIDLFSLKYYWLSEKYGLYDSYSFLKDKKIGEEVTAEVITKIKEIDKERKIEAAEKQRAKEEREERRKSMTCEILKQGNTKGEAWDPYAIVRLTDPDNGESLEFICRNIYDVGYVINPNYSVVPGAKGGICVKDRWETTTQQGRELNEFEKRCLKYLYEFSPISKGIRM